MPEYMRNTDGWYEEDEQWAKVAVVFPDAFLSGTVVDAYGTLKNWHPDAYEKFTGHTRSHSLLEFHKLCSFVMFRSR